jgi:hypothetical protein
MEPELCPEKAVFWESASTVIQDTNDVSISGEDKMTVSQVIQKMGFKVLSSGSDQEVTGGYVSDLLSDVIANAEEGALWITVQRHMNIVAVAQLKKVAGIVLTRGLQPDPAILEKSGQEGIYVLQSDDDSFTVSGKLYLLLKKRATPDS